jgi:hypothetical protein
VSRSSTIVELEATSVKYFAPGDERAFFAWLDQIPCVKRYAGRGHTLYISVDAAAVDQDGLRELLALFFRYGIELGQLAALDRNELTDWFRDKKAYWYKEVFGKPPARRRTAKPGKRA